MVMPRRAHNDKGAGKLNLHVFRRRLQSTTFGTFFGLLTLGALLGFTLVPQEAVRAVYAVQGVAFGILSIRAFRSSSVLQWDDVVVVRSIHWTHRLRRKNVVGFFVGRIDMFGRQRAILAVELRDGERLTFRSFNGPEEESSAVSVASVVAALNRNWGVARG